MNEQDSDKYLIQAGASTIVKVVFVVCCTILSGMYLSNCKLDAETIASCEASCNKSGSHMSSVTSGKCVCTSSSGQDIWVLPQ